MPADVMTPDKQKDTGAPNWFGSAACDRLSRVTVVLVFALLLLGNVQAAIQPALVWDDQPLDYTLLPIAARVCNALFLALMAVTTMTRLRPIQKAAGIEPRLSALLGTFMLMTLALLPRAELPPAVLATSSALVIVGMSASFFVLRWLGKSFSIMAEARRLITHGPYALVRHPLYICEEVAVIGIFIQVISPRAFIIVLIHALFQFRRMLNEENILRATFADYDNYVARTPRLIPFAWSPHFSRRRNRVVPGV